MASRSASFGNPAVVPGNEEVSVAVTRSHERGGVLEDLLFGSRPKRIPTTNFFCLKGFYKLLGWFIHSRKNSDISIKIDVVESSMLFYVNDNLLCCFGFPLSPPWWLLWLEGKLLKLPACLVLKKKRYLTCFIGTKLLFSPHIIPKAIMVSRRFFNIQTGTCWLCYC